MLLKSLAESLRGIKLKEQLWKSEYIHTSNITFMRPYQILGGEHVYTVYTLDNLMYYRSLSKSSSL